MLHGPEVRRGVTGGGVVAAANVPALLADPQVHPVVAAGGQTVLAARGRWNDVGDPVEMSADSHRSFPSSGGCFRCRQLGRDQVGAPAEASRALVVGAGEKFENGPGRLRRAPN